MREEVLNLMVSSIPSWHAYFGLEQKFSGGRSLFLFSIEQAYNMEYIVIINIQKNIEKINENYEIFLILIMREEVLNLMVSSIRSWHAYFGLEQKFSGGRSLFLFFY